MPARDLRVLAILPALNEETTVGDVIGAVRSKVGCDVLVIDDGSTDHTADRALSCGAAVVRHPFNLGVGAAVRTGLRYANEHHYECVVQIDADGQHDAGCALDLLEPARQGGADLVIGSRFANGYEVSGPRSAGMRLLARICSRRVGVALTDTTSGFRAFGPRAIAPLAGLYPSEYLSDTVEALLIAHDLGLRIAERPVSMHPRMGGRSSAGWFRSTYLLVRLLLVIAFHPLRRSHLREAAS